MTGSDGWLADVRYGLRGLRNRGGFSATVIVTVALAVGATTSVFSVVNGVLLRPLDYPEPDRLVLAWQTNPDWNDHPNAQLRAFAERFPLSIPTFFDWEESWKEGRVGLEAFGLQTQRRWVLQSAEGAEIVAGGMYTSGAFRALGIDALLGRSLAPEDDLEGATPVAVISHAWWQDRFGGERTVLGRTLSLDGEPYVIVGVMPPGFAPPRDGGPVWTSLVDEERHERGSQGYTVLGRLAQGATVESLHGDLDAVQARLGEVYPEDQGNRRANVQGLLDTMVGGVRSTLLFLLAAVGLVLAIACVNIANMLSVAGLARRREIAVRSALGASRGRLLRTLLTESGMLAALGGIGGVVLASATLPALLRLLPSSLPRADAIGVDGSVLAFGLLVTCATAMLVGTLPALQAAGTQPRQMIESGSRGLAGGRGGQRVRTGLVVTEVALAFVLLLGASLLGTSFSKLWNVERGFYTEGLVAMWASPNPADFPETADQDRFRANLRDRLENLPGVEVTRTNQIPLSGSSSTTTYHRDVDGEEQEVTVMISVVEPNYFDVMEIALVEGRGFDGSERAGEPRVGVVNQAYVDEVLGGESALGSVIHARSRSEAEAAGPSDDPGDLRETTIVGVARNVRHHGLQQSAEPKLYVPAAQNGRSADQWVLRVQGEAAPIMELARQAVMELSPATPVRGIEVLDERIAASVAVPRFRTLFVVGLALMASVLALLGVYGVVTFAVSQRTRELAVRMAIGAHPGEVVASTLTDGLKLAVAGAVLGGGVAIWSRRLLEEFLYEVDPVNPLAYLGVAVTLALVAVGASWVPARRAARVDPVTVLNAE
jgi:putative ABC transport system permease protein